MNTLRTLLALLFCVLLGACAATGVKVSEAQISALKPGETTEAQVLAMLGTPTMRMRYGDGQVMIQYVYAEARVRAATFIPIVGAFAGGSDVKSSSVVLMFGTDGILKTTSTSESSTGTGTGLASGNASPDTQQPR